MKINEIKLNKENPRIIKDDKFKKLKNSISEFPKMMVLRPIVVDDDFVILGGNMRYQAIKDLGYKEIPDEWVKKASSLTEDEKKRFIISDNASFGEWDFDILANEWDYNSLQEWGLDLNYDIEEINNLDSVQEYDFNENEIEEIDTSIKEGDIFKIGDHYLMCGDSFDKDCVSKLMQGNKARIVFTDPPYDLQKEDYANNIELFTHDAHVFVMHDDRGIVEYLKNSKIEFKKFFVANFGFSSPRGNDPYLNHILISHEQKGKPIPHKNMHDGVGSILKLEYRFRNKEENYGHKHQKPINFVSIFINHYSNEDFICLDLFGGSGSTMATCQQLKRRCYTMELDPRNCQIIINRMQKCYGIGA